MGDIARIAVEEQQDPAGFRVWQVPAVQPDIVRCFQGHLFVLQPPRSRGFIERLLRKKDHGRLSQIHPAVEERQQQYEDEDLACHGLRSG